MSTNDFELVDLSADDLTIDDLLSPLPPDGFFRLDHDHDLKSLEDFEAFLLQRKPPEEPYGMFSKDVSMCRFFDSKDGEKLLADIEQKNKEQGMGNIQIPNTNIKMINYSICPKCSHVFSYKELRQYYNNPQPDKAFKDRTDQLRQDTRVLCDECKTYFLPALVIVDGTPKNEVQFLCRMQTLNAIEKFFQEKETSVLTKKRENLLEKKQANGKTIRAVLNDVLLADLTPKPTLISNLLQYTPANLALNLIDGSNVQKGDLLFGSWAW